MSDTHLRERKKAAIRAKVLEVAQLLFHRTGFATTTIDQICAEALISKRTFFRYFRDKESLVFPHREVRLTVFVAFLESNQDAENPFDVLRHATRLFGSEYHKNKERLRSQQSLIANSPPLLSREREIDQDWQLVIANAFSARAGHSPENDLWAQVLAGAIMGVVRSTMNFWFAHNCENDLTQLGLDALDYLERGFPSRADVSTTEFEGP